jgi:uncharacterized protein YndB with AHSA1/START domain
MTATTNETTITVDSKVPLVRIMREFDAPRERVFRAHTDPDLLKQWLGPRRLAMRIDHYDSRTGGSYRYVHAGDDGVEHWFHGSFHEVRPSELIVQTFTYEGFPDQVALQRCEFEDLGGRTRLTATSLVDSFEARDGFVASGMKEGVREGYERLDEILSG